ncbi:MAG: Cu(I)-responsive transcriptional regulator, partial [Rhodospirillales bacterium]|nr:Cu(I)-responsive transcriptional regulator [Rhodospirillales bacterium]MCW9040152.1 Cu(I)-responsive transcriptional regulator [Rhodospirillales bacterium]
MNIGSVSAKSGVPAKTIRYYESIGLIPEPPRTEGGYRSYGRDDLERLRFIHRARSLGFSIKDVGNLLELWRNRSRASADVKALAHKHVAEIETRIAQMESMRQTLLNLINRCHGDNRPDCPILNDLA